MNRTHHHRRRAIALGALAAAFAAQAPLASAAYDENQNWMNAYGRTVDHWSAPNRTIQNALVSASNVLNWAQKFGTKPFDRGAQQTGAWPWNGDVERGSYDTPAPAGLVKHEFEYDNDGGLAIAATVWAPDAARIAALGLSTPLPGVVYAGGVISAQPMYYWFAQELAKAGYVVMTYDLSGQGRSEGSATGNGAADLRDALDFFTSTPSAPYDKPLGGVASNPLHALLDRTRIGTAGHSLGAGAVQSVGSHNGVVDAISAHSDLQSGYTGNVPIQGQGADYESFVFPPQPSPATGPNSDGKLAGYRAAKARNVDAQEIVIESGTHMAWSHVTWAYTSIWSEPVATWYSVAWFDRYLHNDLKRDPATGLPAAGGLTATQRVTANYEAVPGHGLSKKYRSAYALTGAGVNEDMDPTIP